MRLGDTRVWASCSTVHFDSRLSFRQRTLFLPRTRVPFFVCLALVFVGRAAIDSPLLFFYHTPPRGRACLFVCSFVPLARRLPPSFHHTHTHTSPFVLYLWTFGTILLGTAVRVYNYVQGPVYLSIQRVGVVTGNFR